VWYRHGRGEARLGLAIARKQVRRAVDRNRLKRIARECFRKQRDTLHGIDLVVMARAEAAKADTATLRASLERLMGRIRRD
jgi:ribonuclease P protein component